MGTVKPPASDLDIDGQNNVSDAVKKEQRKLKKAHEDGLVDLILSMEDTKSFNIVQEHENDLHECVEGLK